jgi:hypothetical protein
MERRFRDNSKPRRAWWVSLYFEMQRHTPFAHPASSRRLCIITAADTRCSPDAHLHSPVDEKKCVAPPHSISVPTITTVSGVPSGWRRAATSACGITEARPAQQQCGG